jgi:molybdenum cofactor guanylyltransferase
VTGALLAGGRARRAGGVPKGLAVGPGGQTLSARLLQLLEPLCEARFVVATDPAYAVLGVPLHPDVCPGKGPVGGVHTALTHAAPGWVCVVACDLPLVSAHTLERLMAARDEDAVAVVARAEGRLQPLVGLWHTRALPQLAALLPQNVGFGHVVDTLQARIVDFDDGRPFMNLNRLEEFTAAGWTLPEC